MNRQIYVLLACECSQVECIAFRERGYVAYSCDIVPAKRTRHPEWHIHADVTPFLQGRTQFKTQDGKKKKVPRWDLIIAHPPCTYLCKVSSVCLVRSGQVDKKRLAQMQRARKFFQKCLDARAPYVAVENPLPMRRAQLPPPTTYVQPFEHGHPWTKKTLLWLRNLPPILPTAFVPGSREFVRSHRGKYRSVSFKGIAQAMAEQWGDYIKTNRL